MKPKEYYNYLVYDDGRVYSNYCHRFLKGDVTKFGYLQYTLVINNKSKRIRANRLVAFLFLELPLNEEDILVNHKDGNKLNNHYLNLEWSSYEKNNKHARDNGLNNISSSNHNRWLNSDFREKTAKKISSTQRQTGCFKGKKNPNFKYLIIDDKGKEYTRVQLSNLLNLSLSRTDFYIKNFVKGNNNQYFEKYKIKIINTKK